MEDHRQVLGDLGGRRLEPPAAASPPGRRRRGCGRGAPRGRPCPVRADERIGEDRRAVPRRESLQVPRVGLGDVVEIPSPDPDRPAERRSRRDGEPPALRQRGGLQPEAEAPEVGRPVAARRAVAHRLVELPLGHADAVVGDPDPAAARGRGRRRHGRARRRRRSSCRRGRRPPRQVVADVAQRLHQPTGGRDQLGRRSCGQTSCGRRCRRVAGRVAQQSVAAGTSAHRGSAGRQIVVAELDHRGVEGARPGPAGPASRCRSSRSCQRRRCSLPATRAATRAAAV